MRNFKCKYCSGTSEALKVNFLKNPHYKQIFDPKWLIQIAQMCVNCGKYQQFLAQTEELRQELYGQTLIPLDLSNMHTQHRSIKKPTHTRDF